MSPVLEAILRTAEEEGKPAPMLPVVASNYLDDCWGRPGEPGYYEGHWAVVDGNNTIWLRGRRAVVEAVALELVAHLRSHVVGT